MITCEGEEVGTGVYEAYLALDKSNAYDVFLSIFRAEGE